MSLRFSVAILVYSRRRGIVDFSSSMLPDCFHHWTLSLISADELFCWPIQLAWQFLCLSGFRWLSSFIQGDAGCWLHRPKLPQHEQRSWDWFRPMDLSGLGLCIRMMGWRELRDMRLLSSWWNSAWYVTTGSRWWMLKRAFELFMSRVMYIPLFHFQERWLRFILTGGILVRYDIRINYK